MNDAAYTVEQLGPVGVEITIGSRKYKGFSEENAKQNYLSNVNVNAYKEVGRTQI